MQRCLHGNNSASCNIGIASDCERLSIATILVETQACIVVLLTVQSGGPSAIYHAHPGKHMPLENRLPASISPQNIREQSHTPHALSYLGFFPAHHAKLIFFFPATAARLHKIPPASVEGMGIDWDRVEGVGQKYTALNVCISTKSGFGEISMGGGFAFSEKNNENTNKKLKKY